MQKPVTRRSAFQFLALSASAGSIATMSLQVAAAPLVEGQTLPQGYGRCASCACPNYAGNYNVCQNCGHNYATHW